MSTAFTVPMLSPPRVLTIAGSDSGGGAGIQADLKTFAAHGVYGMSAITAVTAQNTREVSEIHEVTPDTVAAQIDAVMNDIPVDAVKIGMLSSASIVRAVAARLRAHQPPKIVLDPVMISKSGAALLADDAVQALLEDLLPIATLVTPNLPEAARLSGQTLSQSPSTSELLDAGRALVSHGPAVLLKGGHDESGPEIVDILFDGTDFQRFPHPRLDTRSTHGTGCTLSSAIAARLALGNGLPVAVSGAIEYLHGAIAAAYPVGGGQGPVDHLYRLHPRLAE